MTDLVLRAVLKADGSGLVGQTRLSREEMDKLTGAIGTAGHAADALAGATGVVAAAEIKAAGAVHAAAAEVAASTLGLNRSKAAHNDNEKAASANAYAMRNAGQQFGDFGLQVASGQDIARAFGQQIGQLGYALSEFQTGPLSKVGAFLVGPWGIAFTVATAVLAPFIEKLFSAGDASSSLAKDQDHLAAYLDKTTGKVKEQISYLALLGSAQDLAQKQATARAAYDASRQQFVTAVSASTRTSSVVTPDGPTVELPAAITGKGADAVRAILADYERGLDNVTDTTKRFQALVAKGIVPAGAVKGLTDAAIVVDRNSTANNELVVQLARTAIAAGTASKAQRDLVAANVESSSAVGEHIKNLDALRVATTAVEKARASLRLVEEGSAKAEAQGGQALKDYAARHLAAAQAVATAEAAEKDARAGKRDSAAATREANKEQREAEKVAREAATANRELEASFDRLVRRIDPATFAAREFVKALKDINALKGAGKIDAGQAILLDLKAGQDKRDADTKAWADALKAAYGGDPAADVAKIVTGIDNTHDAVKGVDKSVRESADIIADAFGRIFGSGAGSAVGSLIKTLSGVNKQQYDDLAKSITKVAGVFGIDDAAATKIGAKFAKGFQGADTGAFVNTLDKQLGISKALGLKSSKAGAEAGGALGALVGGPIGSIVGSIAGSILGGLFKSTPQGKVTLTSATGDVTATGNSSAAKTAATGLAGSVQDGLQQIADQLGGVLGQFNITVGQRHGDYRVNTSGTSLKVAKGAKDFDGDAASANAYALQQAIAQGAVQGLSAAVQQAIKSSTDVNKALAEALQVQSVEELLSDLGSNLVDQFKDFEKQAANRIAIARKYGFDLTKLEEVNAKERADLFDKVMSDRVGQLKDVLQQIQFGDLFEGSATEQRTAILGEIAKAKTSAAAGEDGAADKLAGLEQQLLQLSRDAFGTAGGEYSGDRASAVADLNSVLQIETDRVKAAQDQARQLAGTVEAGNSLQSENNDQTAQLIAQTAQMVGAVQDLPARIAAALRVNGASAALIAATSRQVQL